MRRTRDIEPLQLFAIVVSVAIVAAGVAGWFQAGSDPRGIILWALACALTFEWILLPLAWLLDRIAFGPRTLRPVGAAPAASPANRAYLRVPALLSALLLIVFAPLIFRADTPAFAATTGVAPPDYLTRWLLATAAMFAVSALAYAVSLRRRRLSGR